MNVRLTSDPAEFQATTFPFLEADPVLHTLIMTNVADRVAGRYPAEAGPAYFVSVHDDAGEVVGAAMRTPGRPVYVGALRADLAAEVAEAYAEVLPELSGVAGDRAAVRAFGQRWTELRGLAGAGSTGRVAGTESRGTRLHRLDTLTPLVAAGNCRPMRAGDVQLAAEWMSDGFPAEAAFLDATWAERQLAQGTMWFWEVTGEPVSMASFRLPLFGVSRVGPVYTPPERRRNGYAGALTGEISAKVLAQGNQACLYTDLANPTSNKIYAQLGYVPVADFIDLTFTA
ncbi:GNAT family N-acetyltransferase [Kribbella catacumbae]|uniref:GNAT family N-acetyltransferase n=1 Tax=Kribbella catacumbae TaxID=460086 RepID=UPI00037F7F0C|nr:GNAT family N-acetyltransferase [Kribbella catacumbae]